MGGKRRFMVEKERVKDGKREVMDAKGGGYGG